MSLANRDKELVALAISVAAGCRPCVTHHLIEGRKAGADDAAIGTAVGAALCVRKAAAEGMRRHALGLVPAPEGCGCATSDLLNELMALGAALAVNCTAEIQKHLAASRAAGAGQEDLDQIFALASTIRTHAISHAETSFTGADSSRCQGWDEAARTMRCC